MASARLLVFACAAAATLAAHAHAQNACTYSYAGDLWGVPYHLVETHLTPGVADWKITVPILLPDCANGYVTGQKVMVCDYDAPPFVSTAEQGTVFVHRSGWLQGCAVVNVTLFCVFPGPEPMPLYDAQPDLLNRSTMSHPGTEATTNAAIEAITEVTPSTETTLYDNVDSNEELRSEESTTWGGLRSMDSMSLNELMLSSDESTTSEEKLSINTRVLRREAAQPRLVPPHIFQRFMSYLRGDW